jgi:hypothetical protein
LVFRKAEDLHVPEGADTELLKMQRELVGGGGELQKRIV